jgi:hypothetical protein
MDGNIILTIIGAILGNTAILGGIAAFWKWWSGRVDKSTEYQRQREVDQREHLQTGQADALKSLIGVTELLVKNLIGDIGVRLCQLEDAVNNRFSGLEESLRPVIGTLADVRAQLTITNRDWSRMEEIVSDIDLVMSRIEAALQIEHKKRDES